MVQLQVIIEKEESLNMQVNVLVRQDWNEYELKLAENFAEYLKRLILKAGKNTKSMTITESYIKP